MNRAAFRASSSQFALALVATALLATGCSLRPRYQDFVTAERLKDASAPVVALTVMDKQTNRPLAGAKVEVGEFPKKFSAVSDAEGLVNLPLEKRYHTDNAIIAVTLPKGVTGYKLVVASPATPAPDMPAADAGTP